MFPLFRWRHRPAQRQQPVALPQPAWQCLISPVFRLVTFGLIACYIQVLVGDGHSLAAAVLAAVGVAMGAWVSNASDPFTRFATRRA